MRLINASIRWLAVPLIVALIGTWAHFRSLGRTQEKIKIAVSEAQAYTRGAIPPVKIDNVRFGDTEIKLSPLPDKGKVLGRSLHSDEQFEADNNFLENLSFKVTNVWPERRITFMRLMINLYTADGTERGSLESAFAVDFGPPKVTGDPSDFLDTNQSATISVPQRLFPELRAAMKQLPAPVVRVGLYAEFVVFSDGLVWNFDGKMRNGVKDSKASDRDERDKGAINRSDKEISSLGNRRNESQNNYRLTSASFVPTFDSTVTGASCNAPVTHDVSFRFSKIGLLPELKTMLQLPDPYPNCPSSYCFSTQGPETGLCTGGCITVRQNWYSPSPGTGGGDRKIKPILLGLPCYEYLRGRGIRLKTPAATSRMKTALK